MALTYKKITSTTLGSNTGTVLFDNIPDTYTDLILKASVRGDTAGTANITVQINATGGTAYSVTDLTGYNSAAASSRTTSDSSGYWQYSCVISTYTSNTFSSIELYIPSYQVSQNKPFGGFATQENNATASGIASTAFLWRNTAAITSITLNSGSNFVSGSSFYLYGIKAA